jgi:hypothetical protein
MTSVLPPTLSGGYVRLDASLAPKRAFDPLERSDPASLSGIL